MSKIEWTQRCLDVSGGCCKCAGGCKHCWATREVWRLAHNPLCGDKWKGLGEKTSAGLRWTGKIKLFPEMLDVPLRRKKSTTYFVNSKSDLFHKDVPFEFILKIFGLSIYTPWHTYQILTKRIDRVVEFFQWWRKKWAESRILWGLQALAIQSVWSITDEKLRGRATKFWEENYDQSGRGKIDYPVPWPHPNVHIGVSCSTEADANKNIPILLQIPVAVHYVSFEPLLGNIDALKYLWLRQKCTGPKGCGFTGASYEFDNPKKDGAYKCPKCGKNHTYLVTNNLDWVIVGSESGPQRRSCKTEYVRSLVEQCKSAGVPVFVKQVDTSELKPSGVLGYKVSKNPEEWPEDLRLREYPDVA